MVYIFKKEVVSFFSSLTGYVAVVVFLLAISWFLWLSPNQYNVLEAGYANMDGLFALAPWLLLLLVPAITMRSFAEERKTGTIEMLQTKPLTNYALVWGKWLAACVVVLVALAPALLYLYTVHTLGLPVGNVDTGATWGALVGVLLIGAGYAAIGIFASTFTDSQIVAFILAAGLSFFMLAGFDGLAQLEALKGINNYVAAMGIQEHYRSLGRGVLDVRDLAYFAALILVFIAAARLRLQSARW